MSLIQMKSRLFKNQRSALCFNSKVLLEEVNEVLHIEIENDDIDTIGGWMLMQNIDIQEGESFKLLDTSLLQKKWTVTK